MKKEYFICTMFLAILMACATLPPVQGAIHKSVTWGSTYHPYSPDDPQVPNWFSQYEQPAQSSTASYIISIIPQAGANWVGTNNYGSSTTAANVYTNSLTIQSNAAYDFLATFHVGDFYPLPNYLGSGVTHYAYYVDYPNPTNGVVDTTLSSYTGAKHKFTFIWTCVNGGTTVNGVSNYGYTDANGRVVGMPLAWTQKTNLSKTGYTNPDGSGYAYIGFENTSKYLTDNRDFINGNYGDFCRQFYYYAFVQHLPIKTSLDRATQDVMANPKVTFASTSLYNGYWFTNTVHGITSRCYMRVIGDGNMVLPY